MLNHVQTTLLIAPLRCIECRRQWLVDAERWRLKLLIEEDATTEAVPYCPDCHDREFGDS